MPKIVDIANQRFGKLIALTKDPVSVEIGRSKWICQCDCGNVISAFLTNLNSGKTQGCGCTQKEAVRQASKTHGLYKSAEYHVWKGMKARCYNKNEPAYPDYGGRGITMCEEWKESFEAFYSDMGPRPSNERSIDRKDNNLGYYKENCRWATQLEQVNNRRNNLFYEHEGLTRTLGEWCRHLGLKYVTVYDRIANYGWEFGEAIQPIESKEISFEDETKILQDWCELFDLPKGKTYLRILRGELLENIVKEQIN